VALNSCSCSTMASFLRTIPSLHRKSLLVIPLVMLSERLKKLTLTWYYRKKSCPRTSKSRSLHGIIFQQGSFSFSQERKHQQISPNKTSLARQALSQYKNHTHIIFPSKRQHSTWKEGVSKSSTQPRSPLQLSFPLQSLQ